MKYVIILLALAAITAIAQNRWDAKTAEEKQISALNYIIGFIIVMAVAVITAIMI